MARKMVPVDRGRGGTGGRPPRRTPVVTSSSATAPRRKPQAPSPSEVLQARLDGTDAVIDALAQRVAQLEQRVTEMENNR